MLLLGCVVLGTGVAMLLAADLGSDGYSTFVNGLALSTGMRFWVANTIVGVVLVTLAAVNREARRRGRAAAAGKAHDGAYGLVMQAADLLDAAQLPRLERVHRALELLRVGAILAELVELGIDRRLQLFVRMPGARGDGDLVRRLACGRRRRVGLHRVLINR